MGGSSGVTLNELLALAEQVLARGECVRPDAIATLSAKRADPVWVELASHYDCALCFFDAVRLEQETPRLKNPSDAVFRAVGCHGVAEAAALAVAGPHGILAVEKTASVRATAALAIAGFDAAPQFRKIKL
ncbi:cobalamin biosynthesis protein [Brucella intermedia]|uniref:cobalamin biosynthesis protein n=1 Tax=Brucella intermedia TaxID=94625 RepID=UPI00124CD8A4|nr:cobalamin biosynthesis protein [Brucella intermedia]KAB2733939.1 cobalamin biosynthesis protein [Brucella intermedia]